MKNGMTNAKALGRAISMVRAGRGLKQKQLAQMASCDPSHISLIECGAREPSMEILRSMAKVLAVAPARLLELQTEFLKGEWRP